MPRGGVTVMQVRGKEVSGAAGDLGGEAIGSCWGRARGGGQELLGPGR